MSYKEDRELRAGLKMRSKMSPISISQTQLLEFQVFKMATICLSFSGI